MSHVKYMVLTAAATVIALWALGVPVLQALPLAVFLACPVMMLFMMRGMDHGGNRHAMPPAENLDSATNRSASPTLDDLSKIDGQYRR